MLYYEQDENFFCYAQNVERSENYITIKRTKYQIYSFNVMWETSFPLQNSFANSGTIVPFLVHFTSKGTILVQSQISWYILQNVVQCGTIRFDWTSERSERRELQFSFSLLEFSSFLLHINLSACCRPLVVII